MNNIEHIRDQLREFKNCDKFKEYGHLQPAVMNSTPEDKKFVNDEMNLCTDQLLKYLEKGSVDSEGIENIVKESIERVEDAFLDTEDKEFCFELYYIIGKVTGVDMNDYGKSIEEYMLGGLERMMRKAGLN